MLYCWIKGPEQMIESRIEEAIEKGWTPLGGPISIGDKVFRNESRRHYAQAMIMEKAPKPASRKKRN